MNEVSLLNRLFCYFYQNKSVRSFLIRNLDGVFKDIEDHNSLNIERLCEQLYDDGFLYKDVENPNTGLATNRYSLSTAGILLFEELSEEYKEQPYTFHLIKLREIITRQRQKEDLELSSIQSSINVGKSVEETNKTNQELAIDTKTFYEKQSRFNWWQKLLTFAITISAIASGAAAICTYYHTKEVDQRKSQDLSILQLQVHQLDSTLKLKIAEDSNTHSGVKNTDPPLTKSALGRTK